MKPWRSACEEALRDHSEADAIAGWGFAHSTEHGPRPPFDYRFEHTLATVKLSRWLCPQVGADADVVECAAWLHDVRKVMKRREDKDFHARDAAAAVAGILAGSDFPAEKIPAVRQAIESHVGLKLSRRLEPVETAALWDCDKLSKLGAASLVHFASIGGAHQPVTTAEILRRGEAWLELAAGIAASMNTPPAKAEAGRRLAFLKRHYEQLQREWHEPMQECPG
jgi:uncharacterized protein